MLNNVESLNLRLYGSIDDLKFASIDSYPSNVHVFFFFSSPTWDDYIPN